MKHMRILLALALFAGVADAKPLSEWLKEKQNNLKEETLPNGLTVLIYPMPGTHVVHVGITYDVGSKNERSNEHGFAHMVEHMIFKGTERMSESDLDAIAQKYGLGSVGQGYNASTSKDLTRYYFTTDKNNYPVFLDIVADCMNNVRFDDNHFASEVKAVIEEANIAETNIPKCIDNAHASMIYNADHPYYHPTLGSKPLLLASKGSDLKAFYQRNYHPSKALLTITGDVDPKKALESVKALFKQAPSPIRYETIRVATPKEDPVKKIVHCKPIPKPVYCYFWTFPADDKSNAIAGSFINSLNRKLQKKLKDENDLVFGVGASTITQHLESLFFCSFEPKEGVDPKKIKEIILQEIEKLATDGPSLIEFEAYKTRSEIGALKCFETPSSVAHTFEVDYFPLRSTKAIFEYPALVQGLTTSDVITFIKTHFTKSLRRSIVCLPLEGKQKEEWLKKREEDDKHEKNILEARIRATTVEEARYAHTLPAPVFSGNPFPKPDEKYQLKNGLTVYLKKRDATPFMNVEFTYRDSEQIMLALHLEKKQFVADLATDLLYEGSTNFTKDERIEFFDKLGATATIAVTGFSCCCLPSDFVMVGKQCLYLIKNPLYDEGILEKEKSTRLEELESRKMNLGYMTNKIVSQALYKKYPWIYDEDTNKALLKEVSRDDLIEFNNRSFDPASMFVTVVGNFDEKTIKADIKAVFGSIKRDASTTPLMQKKPHIPHITVHQAGKARYHHIAVEQALLTFARITEKADSDVFLALSLAEQYLSYRIFQIREKTGLFYSSNVNLCTAFNHRQGNAYIVLPLSVGNIDAVEKEIKDLLAELAKNGIPQDEIDKAKLTKQMAFARCGIKNKTLQGMYNSCIDAGYDFDFYEKQLERVLAMTKEDVDAIVRIYLDPAYFQVFKIGRVQEPSKGWFSWLF